MTVIAAIHDPGAGVTHIGSDTISVTHGTILKNGPKWVRWGNWAAGMAGDKVAFNIVQAHADSIFKDPPGAWTIAMRIRDLFSEYGFNGDGEAGPQGYEQNIIIACPQGVWHVGSNFGLVDIQAGELWGDGAGRQYALGAAHATAADGKGSREQLEAAIAAACRYDNECGGEPWIDELRK